MVAKCKINMSQKSLFHFVNRTCSLDPVPHSKSRLCHVPDVLNLWVMAHPPWNESYASGELPRDTGEPEPLLVEFVTSGRIQPTQTLEIGAGTGTNSIWLAERGFDLVGIDVAPRAVERATAKLNGRALPCRFASLDFLASAPEGGPFEFIFDRGCFHVFDEPEERGQFAAQVTAALVPGSLWLSLIGSTEGSPAGGRPAAAVGSRGHAGHRTGSRNR